MYWRLTALFLLSVSASLRQGKDTALLEKLALCCIVYDLKTLEVTETDLSVCYSGSFSRAFYGSCKQVT